MKIIGGLLRKEFKLLFKNKTYLNHSFSMSIMFTILLFIICRLVDKEYLYSIENMKIYMNLYVPTILAMFGSIGCSTISSISLDNSGDSFRNSSEKLNDNSKKVCESFS